MAQGPFSGIAGALSGVFGGPVTVTPAGGPARVLQAIFRLSPYMVPAENGVEVQQLRPTLRAEADLVADLAEGDLVDPGEGTVYRVLWREETAAPAADALITFQLEVA